MAELNPTTDLELHARVAELEGMLEARTQVIVTLHRRIAELEGSEQSELAERAQRAEDALHTLESTKLFRVAALPRRFYARLRRAARG